MFMKASIKLTEDVTISLAMIRDKQFLFMRKQSKHEFYEISRGINIYCDLQNVVLICFNPKLKDQFLNLKVKLSSFINTVLDVWKQVLRLKGLGYKINLAPENKKDLILKVGYSHLLRLKSPATIITTLRKKRITIYGPNKSQVGDFARKLYESRPVDVYKAKGFSFKHREIFRKEINKK